MSSFTVGGGSATFRVTDAFTDKGGLVEEWACTLIIDDATTWGALFALQTPKELVSVRACRGTPGVMTVSVDIGGGAGVGELVIDDLDTHNALLIDLSSDAPLISGGSRLAKAVFQIVG